MRTFIETKMTEALIRTCYQCKKPFLKVDGCNKMTCACGAKMCYLCRLVIDTESSRVGKILPADENPRRFFLGKFCA